jgi:hypothetical protein
MSSNELKHTSVEIPLTPMSPLKSALKVPGTPGRALDPRSPTFHEELKVEKEEEKTDKMNAKDVVRIAIYSVPDLANLAIESQNSRPHGQVLPAWR